MPKNNIITPHSAQNIILPQLRLALYQPDIPQNTGTMLRMAACLGIGVDIIEPAGFPVSDRDFRRSGMDYIDELSITRHISWDAFMDCATNNGSRLVLLSTKADMSHLEFKFQPNDILIVGRESAGVPQSVHNSIASKVRVPMVQSMRSLNVAITAALVCGEALRQINAWPLDNQIVSK
jgi:tRNA (cytidine/uridine-2'-O-)-methyltransferase